MRFSWAESYLELSINGISRLLISDKIKLAAELMAYQLDEIAIVTQTILLCVVKLNG